MKRRRRPAAVVTAILLGAALVGAAVVGSRAQAEQGGGATTPGATTPGATTPGATTPGAATPGATTPGATTPGATTTSTVATPITTTITTTTVTVPVPELPQSTFIPPRSMSAHGRPASGGASIATGSTPSAAASAPNPFAFPTPPLQFSFDQFQIPLFLLPIYQAAATQYRIPWEILAAINEVETNFGSDLSVSRAGAEGWMQFEPSTWRRYGLDVTASGTANPYDPDDAIFAAARYLDASGAASDLRRAIFAYNHSTAYVDSVLAEASQIARVPPPILNALTGMSNGLFPVHAKATYADEAAPLERTPHTDIFARAGAPVIASEAGQIVAIGKSRRLGRFVELRDAYGTTYTYADLGTVAATYRSLPSDAGTTSGIRVLPTANLVAPLPHTTSGAPVYLAPQSTAARPRPLSSLGSAGPSRVSRGSASGSASASTAASTAASISTTLTTAAPAPTVAVSPASATSVSPTAAVSGSLAAAFSGSTLDVRSGIGQLPTSTASLVSYTPSSRSVLPSAGLHSRQLLLEPGAVVAAGTVLGRIGGSAGQSPHLEFMVRPATARGPLIDPGPLLDSWRELDGSTVNSVPHPAIGQALLMDGTALGEIVLSDPRIRIPSCGREEIAAGQIDRRVLATLEYLADSGLSPTVAALRCGHQATSADIKAVGAGDAVEIRAINGIPTGGHEQLRSITATTVRKLLSLQGVMQPSRIISSINVPDADNVVAERAGANGIEIDFEPLFGPNVAFAHLAADALTTGSPSLAPVSDTTTGGVVTAPSNAPPAVVAAIAAANQIATLPYLWGGGHASFQAPGYDCSGSVSYALAAAGLISSPMVSGQFENWGLPGPGKWITIYASGDHVWMTIAGWRFDTVALAETGTRWASSGGELQGFVVRHPAGL